MNAKKAKALRRKAAVLANIKPVVAQVYDSTALRTTSLPDGTYATITGTLTLAKGGFRNIYKDFKKFVSRPENRNKPLARI